MVLKPISPDPKPTEAELQCERYRLGLTNSRLDESLIRDMARFFWQCGKRQEEPDNFAVPFSTWVFKDDEYAAYRKSGKWKEIRGRVLKKAHYECAGCYNRATEVHHRDYRPRVLAGEDDTSLVPLCKDCHHIIHNKNVKQRASWNEEERVLAALVDRKSSARTS